VSIFLLCSEPGAPPDNVRGQNTSSTSILVQWDAVPEDKQHGEIKHYTVIYQKKEGDEQPQPVDSPDKSVVLEMLDKYTEYSIRVSAATIKGSGPLSIPIVVRTDEDSK